MTDTCGTEGPAGSGPDDNSGDYEKQWKHHEPNTQELISRTRDYIVRVRENFTLDWETTRSYDLSLEVAPGYDSDRHAALDVEISYAEEVPMDGLADNIKLGYLCLIGKAMVCRFEFKYDAAASMLERASASISVRRAELSRQWYLSATYYAAAVPAVIGVIAVLARRWLIGLIGLEGLYLLLATCAGGLGALLSIVRRAGHHDFDRFASQTLHSMEAASRVAVGCISALTVALAVRAHIISGAWVNGDNQLLALLAVSVVAGTGEQLVTSVIDGVHSGLRARQGQVPATATRTASRRVAQSSRKPLKTNPETIA
jgi:hypothetical protein